MTFLSPVLFIFLGAIPFLWWMVRALPPKPRPQEFPSLLFLKTLTSTRQEATHTPLWLLLLRLLVITLLIISFTRPLLLPHQTNTPPHNLIIILDNGWAGGFHWQEKQHTVQALTEETLRIGGNVTLLLTAHDLSGHVEPALHFTNISQIKNTISTLTPKPWASNREDTAHLLYQSPLKASLIHSTVITISDGISEKNDTALKSALSHAQNSIDMRWPRCETFLLRSINDNPLTISAETLPHCSQKTFPLAGLHLRPQYPTTTLTQWFLPSNHPTTLPIPDALKPSLSALNIPGYPVFSSTILLENHSKNHSIGILHSESNTTPLLGNSFYLTQALKNSNVLSETTLVSLLNRSVSIILAPDGTLSEENRSPLLTWIQNGGTLVRFAGNALSHQKDITSPTPLLPVPLLSGMRQLGGPMSWGSPQHLAPFPEKSPFFDLTIPSDVSISRQVLAQPTNDLSNYVWATLNDGTPLITARHEGKGMIILFHITPTADWSTLPLSGLFPQMMDRLINTTTDLTQHTNEHTSSKGITLPAWKILNQQLQLVTPSSPINPLQLTHSPTTLLAPHPVGLYGTEEHVIPLNLSTSEPTLEDEKSLGSRVTPQHLETETPLWPALMGITITLLFLDMVLSLHRTGCFRWKNPLLPFVLFLSFLASTTVSQAASTIPPAALDIRLAYIQTTSDDINVASQQGLEGLTHFVNQRSTAHLESPEGIIIGQNDLSLYPLIYWPILPTTHLNDAEKNILSSYIHHGGILLIDEMGAGSILDGSSGNAVHSALKQATEGLSIPPLTALNERHTLSHTFYLLHDFPGRLAGQTVYVARDDNDESENVSPVIIGNADWIHAWALDASGQHPFAVIPDGDTQRTLAYRFGFNAVIYALTGNYKNDQRHYPEMLKRLKNTDDSVSLPSDENEVP